MNPILRHPWIRAAGKRTIAATIPLRLDHPLTRSAIGLSRVIPLPEEAVLDAYAKYNHGTGNPIQKWLTFALFYGKIDPAIRRDPSYTKKLENRLMEGESAAAWSTSIGRDLESYYIGDGHQSVIPAVIGMVNGSAKSDWRILDLGCGSGNCIAIIFDRCRGKVRAVDGVDYSVPATQAAARRFAGQPATFCASDLLAFARDLEPSDDFRYDIAYSHLCLQLFPETYLRELYGLLREKRVTKTLLVSDSLLGQGSPSRGRSKYNPGRHGYVRWDHDHEALMRSAGWCARVIGDYRTGTGVLDETGYVFWRGDY